MSTESALLEAIRDEARQSADQIRREAQEEANRIESEAEEKGRAEGEERAQEIISEAESRARRSVVRTRSVEEGETREEIGRVRAEILEGLFDELSERFGTELEEDRESYASLMSTTLADAMERMTSTSYLLEVPDRHLSLYSAEDGILADLDREAEVVLEVDDDLEEGFVLTALESGAKVAFDLERYLESMREELIQSLDDVVFGE